MSIEVPLWGWGVAGVLVVAMVLLDLVAHRGDQVDSRRRALVWSLVWIALALAFGVFVTIYLGSEAGEQYFAAYLLEKSLSIDNLFLFLIVFRSLGIPPREQRRVLTWGVIGALVTRGLFIALGSAALARWHWISYAFGGLLLVTAVRLMRPARTHEEVRALRWLQRRVPISEDLDGHHFLTRRSGRWVATPLLVALVAIEATDLVFALDSLPAAFAITEEPFLIYTSNILALLGLRALYSVLAGMLASLRYLSYGLAAVLAFAGAKMLASAWIHVPPWISVGVIVGCIGVATLASVLRNRHDGTSSQAAAA